MRITTLPRAAAAAAKAQLCMWASINTQRGDSRYVYVCVGGVRSILCVPVLDIKIKATIKDIFGSRGRGAP